jgi:hypothetical protein
MAVMITSTRKACEVDRPDWEGGEHRGQFQAGFSAANHMMSLFEIEEQIAVQRVNQQGATKGTRHLGQDVERQFALFEVGENAQGDADGRVEMSAGNAGGQVDRHAYADTPDDADFPQTKAGARDFEGGDAARAKKDQQRSAQEFGHALARE